MWVSYFGLETCDAATGWLRRASMVASELHYSTEHVAEVLSSGTHGACDSVDTVQWQPSFDLRVLKVVPFGRVFFRIRTPNNAGVLLVAL